MGVIYSVYGLDSWLRSALEGYGVVHQGYPDGRNPTIAEVRRVLDGLAGFRVEYEPARAQSWCANVEDAADPEQGQWTQVRSLRYVSEDEPTKVYFEKGWPSLIVEIVHRLTRACGTLGILPDTGEAPLLVTSSATPEHLLEQWEHTRPTQDEEPGG